MFWCIINIQHRHYKHYSSKSKYLKKTEHEISVRPDSLVFSCYTIRRHWHDVLNLIHYSYIVHNIICIWGRHGDGPPHDGVIKWKPFPRYWPFVWGIHRWPVNSCHKGQWRGVLIFSLICAWTNSWANNGDAGDLRRYRAHYDVILMQKKINC